MKKYNTSSIVTFRKMFFLLCLVCCQTIQAQTFSHPCAMHKQSDFNRMKTMVADSTEPWLSGWHALLANTHSSSTYTMQGPKDTVYRGTGYPENYNKLYNDIAAAYANALRWQVSGNTTCADKAVQILNGWGSTLKVITGTSDKYLAAGIYGYQIANVAEIMRGYSGWSTANFNTFKTMMLTVFYPMNHTFLTTHNGACVTHYWANWDLCNMASIMAIGILCDSVNKYNEAVNYFKTGNGNGCIDSAVWRVYPGNLGQWQESGRDQGHNTLGVSLMGPICEMAWNNGTDLYGYNDFKFFKGCEYIAKYNIDTNNVVPYTTYNNCDNVNQTIIAATGRGILRDCWEMVYNHYVNRKGLPATYTTQYAAKVRPEGGGGHYDPNSGGYDQLGYGTLTYSLAPATTTLTPVADAYVQGGTNADTNFGTATSIVTKAGTSGLGYREGYLRFNLASLPANITGARIRLYVKSKEANSTRSIYSVADDTWGESTITYNNKPAYNSTALVTDSITGLGYVDFDITGYIVNQAAGDKLASVCIKDPITNNNIGTDFYSKENGSNMPQLVVITNQVFVASLRNAAAAEAAVPSIVYHLYPNPVCNLLTVKLDKQLAKDASLNIYNTDGKLVHSAKLASNQLSVDMKPLQKGTYFIVLQNGTDKTVKEVIKM
ncbi:DNRLRE domain-containing protein [Parasediminibacterium sp. JCM 36343]|uniref:CBM96 family carbohydrate-binding protein n=1 Tax=Parasediminibacterium sp. JCM 36343 TaxID=3374279 RepID=UPI00397D064F